MTGMVRKACAERRRMLKLTTSLLNSLSDLRDYEAAMPTDQRVLYGANLIRKPDLKNSEIIVRTLDEHQDSLAKACAKRIRKAMTI